MYQLLPKINSIFESKPAVLRIDAEPIMIIGDIHGDLRALNYIIEERKELQGTEVLLRLFQMKIEDPEHIFLLRGNHETIEMNLYYGFYEEFGSDQVLLFRLSQTYDKMPVAVVLLGYTFCVHGGINGTWSIDTITKENAFPYLWNDPSKRPCFKPSPRGYPVREFGPDM